MVFIVFCQTLKAGIWKKNLSSNTTETKFEIEPLNASYHQSLLAASDQMLSLCLQLGNPPLEKNDKWERSKWFGISRLFLGENALTEQTQRKCLKHIELDWFPVASTRNPKSLVTGCFFFFFFVFFFF